MSSPRQIRPKRQQRRGFTLPEIMTAVLILTFVFSVFGAAFPACSQAVSRGRHIDSATDACQQKLESLRATAFASLPQPGTGSSTVTQSFTPPSTLPAASGSVTLTAVDSNLATVTGSSTHLRVDVAVSWQGRGGDRGSVTVTGLLYK
jgi:prepilin-type N-terminal cleavage/methylation domain-containing protein